MSKKCTVCAKIFNTDVFFILLVMGLLCNYIILKKNALKYEVFMHQTWSIQINSRGRKHKMYNEGAMTSSNDLGATAFVWCYGCINATNGLVQPAGILLL